MGMATLPAMQRGELNPLLDHLMRSGLERSEAERLVADVLSYFSETTEAFVRRRHRELQREGIANAEGFAVIARELGCRRVAAPPLSERQIRRVIYG
jgi:hypothetical protein